VTLAEVAASLEAAVPVAQEPHDWQQEPLADLISHIKLTHHRYTWSEIQRLGPLFDKVCSVHEAKHTELAQLRSSFATLAAELKLHMMKEETILFPYIERLEEARIEGAPVLPAPFGTVQNPVAMMVHEHDDAGALLRAMRESSNGYLVPADGCLSYRTLYEALAAFEADLHQHIHLENNILFPRAVAMERA
jgi:regulator of cell morphogenesis and NO signaling